MNLISLSILALTMGHVFSNAVRTLPAIAADVLQRDLGVTADGLAALTGAFPATFALAMLPVGVALDRWGVKPTALPAGNARRSKSFERMMANTRDTPKTPNAPPTPMSFRSYRTGDFQHIASRSQVLGDDVSVDRVRFRVEAHKDRPRLVALCST